jgi:hypothetical protein
MKVHVYSTKQDYSFTTLFDIWYAYQQYLSRDNDYTPDLELSFFQLNSNTQELDKSAVNIGWYHMPRSVDKISADKFDIVLFDNDHHGLEVCTQAIYDCVNQHDNCYMVFGSYLSNNHVYKNKIIYYPLQFVDRDSFTRPVYVQYFEKQHAKKINRKNRMIYINGHNRAHRKYFMDKLTEANLDQLDIKNEIQTTISETKESFFETVEDTAFREHVMTQYSHARRNGRDSQYYNKLVSMGINHKFGNKPPGYMLIDEYFTHSCVIFPETSWLNNQLFITEKIVKCFVAKAIPWPVGGANVNLLYNQLGFKTAWNLLPPELQIFDAELDHVKRTNLCLKAVEWIDQNMEILESDLAKTIVENNFDLYHTSMLDSNTAVDLENIINKAIERRMVT